MGYFLYGIELSSTPLLFGKLDEDYHLETPGTLEILIKSWKEAKGSAFLVRHEVFVNEQGVPVELELDELDASAIHALAYRNGECVGTARFILLGDGQAQIGRMAVLAQFRGQGIGKQILIKLMALAKSKGISSLILHSQVAVMPFYEKLGFEAQGPNYEEAGIAHRNMILMLPK